MKVKFKYGIGSFAGTLDLATFWETPFGGGSFMRKYVKPKLTEHNAELGSASKNLAMIYRECSDAYKSDLRTYAHIYSREIHDPNDPFQGRANGYSIFTKLFYALAAANVGTVDLKTLSFGDLATLFPGITNVAASVDEGFLPHVTGSELLTETM